MGLLSDFKKLFFTQKSVAKSAGKKAADKTKDLVEDVKEVAQEKFEDVKQSTKDMADDLKEKASDSMENVDLDAAIEKAKKFTDKLKGAVTGEEDTNDEPSEDAPKDKLKENPEWLNKAGEKASEAGQFASEKFQEISEKVGKTAMDISDDLSQKTRELADKLDKKLDEIDEKARKMAEKEAAEETKGDHADTRHDENPNLTESSLKGSDSFFDKAKRFADGESITPDIEKDTSADKKQSKSGGKAYGFEDLDGDGNEIIDDAIIDEEDD